MNMHLIIILSVCACAAVGVFVLLRKGGLSTGQQKQILDSHTEAQEQVDQAEGEAQTELQQSAQEAQTDLRALAEREQQQRRELENADTEEQVILQADKVRHRWKNMKNDTLQSPWWVGLLVLLSLFAGCAPAYAATKPQLLTKIKQLSQDLNDCANHIQRQAIKHKQQIRDQAINYKRRLKQKDASLTQCRKENLVYRSKPPGNTGLIVTLTVTGTVATAAVVLLFVSIFRPETFGNQRGGS